MLLDWRNSFDQFSMKTLLTEERKNELYLFQQSEFTCKVLIIINKVLLKNVSILLNLLLQCFLLITRCALVNTKMENNHHAVLESIFSPCVSDILC